MELPALKVGKPRPTPVVRGGITKNMKKEGFSKSIFALSNKLNVKTFIFQNKEESDYEK